MMTRHITHWLLLGLVVVTPAMGGFPVFIGIAGDANGDHEVTLDDFARLKVHFGTGTTWGEGDFDADGDVDLDDFALLKKHFGQTWDWPALLEDLDCDGDVDADDLALTAGLYGTWVDGPLAGPDLILSSLQVLQPVDPAHGVSFEYTVKNVGDRPASLEGPTGGDLDNVAIQAFVSADLVYANAGDLPAGGTIITPSPAGSLAPGEELTATWTGGSGFDPLTHPYVVVKVDHTASLKEVDESNNTAAALIRPADAALVGVYTFDDDTACNAYAGIGALPDLIPSSVGFAAGDAVLDACGDYLALPAAVGREPFTIWIDATYAQSDGHAGIVAQGNFDSGDPADWDFLVAQFVISGVSPNSVRSSVFDADGTATRIDTGALRMDGSRHQIALTWDGTRVGAFFDDTLSTRSPGGPMPDVDGTQVRFGSSPYAPASTGAIHQIRIYHRALTEAELIELGT